MVVKQATGAVGSGAGGFVGGIANNPGIVAIAGIGITIFALLLFFQNDIRKFFTDFQLPSLELPDINLPDITFPTFEFPTFELPTFEFPSIEFPSFEFPTVDLPDIPGAFADFFGGFGGEPSDFTDVGAAAARGTRGGDSDLTPAELFGIEERGAMDPRLALEPSDAELFARDFPEIFVSIPEFSITRELEEIPFAVANVEETQAEFQERSGAFAEAFPDITESTSLPGEDIIFGRQLSRESEDFADVLAAEARRSESIFAALFGNVQNPDFGA